MAYSDIPIRESNESQGNKVGWDEKTRSITITDSKGKLVQTLQDGKEFYVGSDNKAYYINQPENRVTNQVSNATWNEANRTITYVNSNGNTVVLQENQDFYIGNDNRAYFYNNTRTLLEANNHTVSYQPSSRGGSTIIAIKQLNSQRTNITLAEGKDYYMAADNKAHFMFNHAPLPKGPLSTKESLTGLQEYTNVSQYLADKSLSLEQKIEINTSVYAGRIQGIFPVKGKVSRDMNSAYGNRIMNGILGFHDGVDIAANANTPIYNMYYGVVIYADWSNNGYGFNVAVRSTINGNTVEIMYGHMISAPIVKKGEEVAPGTHIGGVGHTGHSSGDHLHVYVQVNNVSTNPDPNYSRLSDYPYSNNPYNHARPFRSYIPYVK